MQRNLSFLRSISTANYCSRCHILCNLFSQDMNRSPLDMKDIECPVYLDLMETWIYQCENGHGMCNKCKPKLTNCPVCKGKLTDERKHDAEMLSLSVKHHCRFQTSGCTQLYFLDDKEGHEAQCLYRHLECPLGRKLCLEEVNPADAKDHILVHHAELVTHRPLNITSFLSRSAVILQNVTKVLVKGDDMFIVHVQVPNVNDTTNMVVSCTYVGSPEDARKYKYMFTLYGQESYGMLSYTKRCLSYLELLGTEKNANTSIILPHLVFQEFYGRGIPTLTYEIEVDKI